MEAKRVALLPDAPGWQFEPKWDGFRAIAFRDGDTRPSRWSTDRAGDRHPLRSEVDHRA